MGLHTGEAHLAGDDYGGFEVNRAARIAAAGHGGQIVVSATTRSLVESAPARRASSCGISAGMPSGTSPRLSSCSNSTSPAFRTTSRRCAWSEHRTGTFPTG